MADIHSKEVRSFNMSMIKSKNTKPEIIVRKFLHSKGFRFRIHNKKLPGKPDIVLPKYHTIIFVHGCFWHGHKGCKLYRFPQQNKKFWRNKFMYNRRRDKEQLKVLMSQKYKVIVIWECEILKKENAEKNLTKMIKLIT